MTGERGREVAVGIGGENSREFASAGVVLRSVVEATGIGLVGDLGDVDPAPWLILGCPLIGVSTISCGTADPACEAGGDAGRAPRTLVLDETGAAETLGAGADR